jgi:Txe/YoeB family toxin of Txe-Axe toxin-antitoxin module
MVSETQAFLAMFTDEDSELSFDLCFECTSNEKQRLSTSSDKNLLERSIDKQPDFSDSYSRRIPYSPLSSNQEIFQKVQKDSFTSSNEIQKIKTRIADSVSLRMKHERDAATQKEIENKLVLELSKLVSHDSHELFVHHTDCKLCLGEKGMAVECLNKDCEYSFDLCFDCGEIQNNSPFPIFLDEQSEKTIQQKPSC